jgi:hypothetical protein
MNPQPAQRAVTTMASPMILSKDEPFLVKLLFVVVALVIGLVCFTALMALASAVMPRTAERCKAVVSHWPIQAFVTGLITWAVGGGLAWYFLSHGYIPRLLKVEVVWGMLGTGLGLVSLLFLLTVTGATGTVRFIGERLTWAPGVAVTPLRQVVVGTLAAVMGSWFPVIGWAVALPGLLCVSSGAAILGWVRAKRLAPTSGG